MRFIVIMLIVLGAPLTARAQSAHLALARVAASECGLTCTEEEVAAIGLVLRTRGERFGMSTEAFARVYSDSVFNSERTDGRAWVVHLRPDGQEPAGWSPTVRWSAFRARWLALYDVAGRVVRGELAPSCTATPDHWGMSIATSIDYRRAIRAGWERIDCGDTRNAFWRVRRGTDG
ncbi:MAG: hypothetical protein M3Q55_09205 [Acidobacteriota bacterium]|nr:hypothetical protein [Acidobacteriota bacterium]